MKQKYNKPTIISNGKIEGVIPAGLPAAVAAFVTGVAAGTQVKKMINGRANWLKGQQLVEVGTKG